MSKGKGNLGKMIILIDGYNLLRQVFYLIKGKLDKQRQQFIKQLGFYKKQKVDTIKEIIVVFDGGLLRHATREIRGGVTVVFSGQEQSADDWIIDYVERNKNKEIMLVTLDREVIKQCKKYNVDVIRVLDFYNVMQNSLLQEVAKDLEKKEDSDHIEKYEFVGGSAKSSLESEALDLLMEQTKMDFCEKDDFLEEKHSREKGPSRKLSKKEKQRLAKLKKL